MKFIDFNTIAGLNIQASQAIGWVEHVLLKKYECELPPKISMKMPEDVFINTMPSFIPEEKRHGVKIVSRYPLRVPSLVSEIMLYDSITGETLALMDGTWITAMRTGAVAALSISRLQASQASQYAFMGLGNTARATLICLSEISKNKDLNIRLLAYKDQEKDFIDRFKNYHNLHFTVYQDTESLINGSDVIVSSITSASGLIAPDKCFKEGSVVVPIHTRGFQNCDLFFDKVFADDTAHVKDFKYFSQFKQFNEFSKVLLNQVPGRESDKERILVYNIGISIHDIYFASLIYDLVKDTPNRLSINPDNTKFWF